MTLARILEASCAREGAAVAVSQDGEPLSYRAWREQAYRVAGGLHARGLRRDDHLVALVSNRREMTVLYWASQVLGLVFTPFNWRASGPEMRYVLDDAEAQAVVYEKRSAAAAQVALAGFPLGPERVIELTEEGAGGAWDELCAARPFAGDLPDDDGATCLMLYTSGTTGRPKGVPRSHAAERNAALTCIAQLGYRYREVSLGVMPLFHTMGIRSLLMSTCLNGTFVCMPTFEAERALALIEAERISALFLVPTLFHDLVNHPAGRCRRLDSVTNLAYAGMSMTTALIAACAERFRPARFANFYGSSEIYTFSVCDQVERKPGCAGRPGIGQTLRVVRADPDVQVGPDEEVAPGETGEIIASMRALDAFEGYWRRPDADAKSIRSGWYYTGDLGRFDEEGELFVLGRVDDMLISGGENIYPEEIEDLLARSELVRGVAVIGLPDERWGQKVVAFVEPSSPAASAKVLDEHCLSGGLARFKRPRSYIFVEAIPRSASGKLLRRHLRSGDYTALTGYGTTL